MVTKDTFCCAKWMNDRAFLQQTEDDRGKSDV